MPFIDVTDPQTNWTVRIWKQNSQFRPVKHRRARQTHAPLGRRMKRNTRPVRKRRA
jgi:hypothetical protein